MAIEYNIGLQEKQRLYMIHIELYAFSNKRQKRVTGQIIKRVYHALRKLNYPFNNLERFL